MLNRRNQAMEAADVNLRAKGQTELIDIEALETIVFQHYAKGLQVQIRPVDTESDVRGRLRSQLVTYNQKRKVKFLGDLLANAIYQAFLYCSVVGWTLNPVPVCYADLWQFAQSLPGEWPRTNDVNDSREQAAER
jgi:hypothetical protein